MNNNKGLKPKNQVPLSTLLHFTKKDELETFMGAERVAALRCAAVAAGRKSIVTKKDIIRAILSDEEASTAYDHSELATAAYTKYTEVYHRLQSPEAKQKSIEGRQRAAQRMKQTLGCMLVNPTDNNGDRDASWGALNLAPSSLKQSVFGARFATQQHPPA